MTWSFDAFCDLRLNKRLNKQSWGWWFETPSCSLWRHCNGTRTYSFLYALSRVFDCLVMCIFVMSTLRFRHYSNSEHIGSYDKCYDDVLSVPEYCCTSPHNYCTLLYYIMPDMNSGIPKTLMVSCLIGVYMHTWCYPCDLCNNRSTLYIHMVYIPSLISGTCIYMCQ